MSDKLLPLDLPVVVATGEYESGKSMLALTTGCPLDRVLIYDNEESVATYHAMNPAFTRVDIAGSLPKNKTWTNYDFYLAWVEHLRSIPTGKYDVIAVDTIERIESGISDWVSKNPAYFGHTANQYNSMSGMFWGDMKDLWGRHILELKARAQMVILTVHMRDVYENRKPVPGKRQRKGKDTLSELASLEVTLQRKKGQAAPSAYVMKTRLVYGDITKPDTLRPMFDPYIPKFTWDVVREYMQHGADPEHPILPPEPTAEEKEEHRLELEATIAAAKLAEIEQSGQQPEPSKPSSNGKRAPTSGPGAFWPEVGKRLAATGFEFATSSPKDKMAELVAANVAGWDAALASAESGTFDPATIP